MIVISPSAFFTPTETQNGIPREWQNPTNILATIIHFIMSLIFIQFLSTRYNKNIIGFSQICQVLTSMPSFFPCPCTQELHIKGPIPLGSLVGGAFLAQAYKILDLSLHVPSSQSLKYEERKQNIIFKILESENSRWVTCKTNFNISLNICWLNTVLLM